MLDEYRRGVQVVHGDVEVPLQLVLVEIDRHHAVDPGSHYQVGHQLGADRHPRLVFPVLTGVSVIRNNRGDPRGTGPHRCVGQDQEFQDILCGWVGRLDDEDILSPNVLIDPNEDLTVCEPPDRHFAERLFQAARNLLGEGVIGRPRQEHQLAL